MNFSGILNDRVKVIRQGVGGIDAYGQTQRIDSVIYASLACRIVAQSGRVRMLQVGQDKVAEYKMMVASGSTIEQNDIIEVISGMTGITIGSADFVHRIDDFSGNCHHFEIDLKEV